MVLQYAPPWDVNWLMSSLHVPFWSTLGRKIAHLSLNLIAHLSWVLLCSFDIRPMHFYFLIRLSKLNLRDIWIGYSETLPSHLELNKMVHCKFSRQYYVWKSWGANALIFKIVGVNFLKNLIFGTSLLNSLPLLLTVLRKPWRFNVLLWFCFNEEWRNRSNLNNRLKLNYDKCYDIKLWYYWHMFNLRADV